VLGKALIVIPTLNEAKHIRETLGTILLDRAMDTSIVVVVDGGSRDGTLEIVSALASQDARVIPLRSERPTPFQSASINFAVERYGDACEWLIRIDAHAEYPRDYVANLISTALETAADSVVAPMVSIGHDCFQIAVAAAQNSVLGTGGSAHRSKGKSGWVDHGHHALMRLSMFKAAGGYDETFSHNEDAELDKRIIQLGGRIWLAEDLAITYLPRRTPGSLFHQYRSYGVGRARTRARHGGLPKLRQILPLLVAPAVALACLGPLWGPAAVPALIWALLCLSYGAFLGLKACLRGQRLCAFLSGFCALIMHFAWSVGYLSQTFKGRGGEPFQQTLAR
jgi:succinoglycan biosynthesis protein ExoA